MDRIIMIIEKAEGGFFGRVDYDDNLIVDEAEDISALEKKMKKLLKEFHQLRPNEIEFDLRYDLTVLFEKLSYLKISSVATLAGVHPGLLRQYVSGVKFPSAEQAKKIEEAIHQIGDELSHIRVYGKPA